jgi:hypothetical protein
MLAPDDQVLAQFRSMAAACERLKAPFLGGMLARIADDATAGGPSAQLLAPWSGEDFHAIQQSLPGMRLMAALNELALSGDDPALTKVFPKPGRPLDLDRAWGPVRAAIAREPERLAEFMTHEPQTNEPARAAMLLGGFLEASRAAGPMPLRCFELGASAGLNTNWDRFHYRLGELDWGDPRSEVDLRPEWRGPSPQGADLEVVSRSACDRRPIDIADPAAARRLLAYVWPDQFERVERLKAAIALALRAGVSVDAADAADWTRARAAPRTGALTVVYHSIFWQYVPPAGQAALQAAIEAHGASATPEAPFAWLRMEPTPPAIDNTEVRLTQWPGGETRTLAKVHPHGAWATWHG